MIGLEAVKGNIFRTGRFKTKSQMIVYGKRSDLNLLLLLTIRRWLLPLDRAIELCL